MPTPDQPQRMPAFNPRSLLCLLWERAAPHLSRRELKWLVDEIPPFIQVSTVNEATVWESLGCLVAADGDGGQSGAFQDGGDVSSLLFMQANGSSSIAGLTHIAYEATGILERALPGRSG